MLTRGKVTDCFRRCAVSLNDNEVGAARNVDLGRRPSQSNDRVAAGKRELCETLADAASDPEEADFHFCESCVADTCRPREL